MKTTISNFIIKLTHWEFWPFEVFYFPIFIYWIWLSAKARSFFFFSASNPGIQTGGMMGESKFSILEKIPDEFKAKTIFIKKEILFSDLMEKIKMNELNFPLIFKPDVGERGIGVEKINKEEEAEKYILLNKKDFLIQEYISLPVELGVFYYRYPDEEKGLVSSVVRKDFLKVTGDGHSTIDALIEAYPRARFQTKRLQRKIETLRSEILPANKTIELEPIGNHCRGTTFLDAADIIDEKLSATFDLISKPIDGFYYGRYDLRCESIESLKEGKMLKIMELNGAGAEPAHIYQPGFSLLKAYKILFRHWRVMYEISLANHRKGVEYISLKEMKEIYKASRN